MRLALLCREAEGQAGAVRELIELLPEHELVAELDLRTDLGELVTGGVEGVAIIAGDGSDRIELLDGARAAGLRAPALIHPDAHLSPTAVCGDAVIIAAGCSLGPDVGVADAAVLGAGTIISHDCFVGAGATLGPGCTLAGRSRIGAGATLEARVTLIPDLGVGDRAVVGAGAVIVSDVPADVSSGGVPQASRAPRPRYLRRTPSP